MDEELLFEHIALQKDLIAKLNEVNRLSMATIEKLQAINASLDERNTALILFACALMQNQR